ncbi:hypothetical protein DPMN_063652 [Dreissena polymorpha]|uniref:Uncharacterized protein n=1 Tax=Dreissena polymorpha TaxID=45954 RepID=A0A9D4CC52_DREPO|nr:hypothetical protein DPMN_063652 [Dreissena polymorpha]
MNSSHEPIVLMGNFKDTMLFVIGQYFRECAANGHEECVDALLHNGADISIQDMRGRTALHLSAMCGHVGLLGSLLLFLHPEDDNDHKTKYYDGGIFQFVCLMMMVVHNNSSVLSCLPCTPHVPHES